MLIWVRHICAQWTVHAAAPCSPPTNTISSGALPIHPYIRLPWGVDVVVVEPSTMRTPLALSFADAWLKNFREARRDRAEIAPRSRGDRAEIAPR